MPAQPPHQLLVSYFISYLKNIVWPGSFQTCLYIKITKEVQKQYNSDSQSQQEFSRGLRNLYIYASSLGHSDTSHSTFRLFRVLESSSFYSLKMYLTVDLYSLVQILILGVKWIMILPFSPTTFRCMKATNLSYDGLPHF